MSFTPASSPTIKRQILIYLLSKDTFPFIKVLPLSLLTKRRWLIKLHVKWWHMWDSAKCRSFIHYLTEFMITHEAQNWRNVTKFNISRYLRPGRQVGLARKEIEKAWTRYQLLSREERHCTLLFFASLLWSQWAEFRAIAYFGFFRAFLVQSVATGMLFTQPQGCRSCCSLAAENEEMDRKWGNGQRMRKWRENEEIKRQWREYEEIERKWRESEDMEHETEWERERISSLYFPLFVAKH